MEEMIDIKLPNGKIAKFPSNMSHDEISKILRQQFPIDFSANKGWKGVGQDIKQGAKDVYPALANMFKQLPSEGAGAFQQLKNEKGRVGKNLIAGLAKGSAGTLNIPANIRDYLVNKEILPENTPSARLPESILPKDYNYAKGVGIEGEMPGDALIQGVGATAPNIMLGEAGALQGLTRTAARTGAQIPFAIGQNENPVTTAGMVPGMEIPLMGAGATYNRARPRHALRGNIPAEELEANARAAEGTNTSLGQIVGSPTLQHGFENFSTKWPGGGGDAALAEQAQHVQQRAEGLLNNSGANVGPGESNAQLKTALENAYETQRQRKNELYEPVNELSAQENFRLELPTFRQRANEHLNQIEDSPLLAYDVDFRRSYNKVAGLTEGAEGSPSILDSNIVASKLHEEGTRLKNNKSASADDRGLGRLYLDLARRMRNDVRTELHQRGSPELNQAFDTATNNYRENFSQFLDEDIYRLAQPEVEAESIINDIIKPGKQKDKFSRIEKIQNALPPEQRNIIGNAWLRNALDKEGTLNPKQFAQLIEKLGPRQFEALFPNPHYRQQLLDYGRLRGMNEKALSRMANPNTGAQLAVPGMLATQGGAIAGAVGRGNFLEALGWALGPQVGSRAINHLMTDPVIRNAVVQGLLEPPRPNPIHNRRPVSPLLTTASGREVYED
jgi:hypothetical protein